MGKGFVLPDGPSTAPVLLVGESPGETEAKEGRPFIGLAGKLLDRLLRGAGLDRGTFRVTNTICCQPPKNYLSGSPWEIKAIASCAPLLEEEIKKSAPRVIVALGNIAFRRLTGLSGISRYRGFPIRHSSGSWVLPTYHPSFLLPRKGQKESAKLTGLVLMDLLRAVEIARDGFHPSDSHYVLDPRPDSAAIWATEFENALYRGEAKYLSWDIETPGKLKTKDEEDLDSDDEDSDDGIWSTQIIRIGFSYRPGSALSIPWRPEYLPVIKRLLQNPQVEQVTWNGYSFDCPVVELNGLIPIAKCIHDGMWAWHTLQSDLPRGLEAVASVFAPEIGPWKHLSTAQPAHYNAIDADAALRNFLATKQELEKNDQWQIYQKHVVDLYPILFEAGRVNGVSIDRIAQDDLRRILVNDRDRLLREAQRLVPKRPGRKGPKTYIKEKNVRSPMVAVGGTRKVSTCNQCGKERISKTHLKKCPGSAILKVEKPFTFWKWDPKWEDLDSDTLIQAIDEVGFNPVSTKQLQDYAREHGHKLGVDYKTGREQLNKRTRQSLIKKYGLLHPIYKLAQELQDITKSLGTYVEGFAPDRKGKIYTTYTLIASTGRLTSRNKNLQNVSHDSRLKHSEAIRRTIVPLPGHVFVECDSSAIESVCTGFFMDDPEYIRLARTGIHDYVTCLELGKEFIPALLGDYRKDQAYEQARDRNKRVIHGTSYGMSPKMMVMIYPEIFRAERDAAYAQDHFLRAVPRLGKWQHEVRLAAHRTTYLQNPWGYRHYYYQVFTKDKDGNVVNGPDAKRVVAFLPQSSAAAIMKDTILEIGKGAFRKFMPANLSVHDSICLQVPRDRVEETADYLSTLMTREIPLMNNLRIGCEVKMGPNWADLKKIKKASIE